VDDLPDRRGADVRGQLDALVARARTPGLQYLVVDADRTRLAYEGGWADIRGRVAMTPATTMMAYSMSKTITAVAVHQLVAAGRLGLDDPIERFSAVPYGPGITVRLLLAHLSGIPNPIPLRWVHPAAQHATFDEHAALAAVLAAHPTLAAAPGKSYRYSNIGYWLLGRVVERAAGMPFPSYVQSHVLAPLGLTPADLGYAILDAGLHAHGYLEKYSFMNLAKRLLIDRALIGDYEGRWLRIEPHYLNGPAFGGLVGTARGFGKFLQDQLRPRSALFDQAAHDRLTEQQRTSAGALVPMTLGWHLGDLAGTRFYYKEGGGGGFHCEMRLYPGPGVASVVMSNATAFDVKDCLNRADRQLFP
jgi:CubicO group peptidase (beta-lactamase class C family)